MRWWKEMNPKARNGITWIGGGVAVISFLTMVLPDREAAMEARVAEKREPVQHILTDRNTRELGADAIAAKTNKQARELTELKNQLDLLQDQLRHKQMTAIPDSLKARLNEMETETRKMKRENHELRRELSKVMQSGVPAQPSDDSAKAEDKTEPVETFDPSVLEAFESAPLPNQSGLAQTGQGRSRFGRDAEAPATPAKIRVIETTLSVDESAEQEEEAEPVYIPSGSIVTAVLLSGLDAPTKGTARRDPSPVLLRVQHEALLPNNFRADVRECFLSLEGYGDLSSERAMFRGTGISCVRADGGVLESAISGYAVGEDGKAGMRGRLVSKQGQLVARAMLAGFAQAAGEAFDVDTVPVIATGSNLSSRPIVRDAFSSETAQGAFVKGTGKALEQVAEFYLDMAEEIFPVIEIDAGRKVDFILTKGVSLQLKDASA
jgi:conjugal transfer pilus assembly protein TraB